MPEHTIATEQAVGLVRCAGLPRMDDLIERDASVRLDDHVHMIRHDAPREKAVSLTVEMKECRLDKLCDARSAEPTCAQAGIELFVRLDKIVGAGSKGSGGR